MAIYGVSFYGEDKYGPPTYVDFSVDPFVATPGGYDHILLSWTSPKGSWDTLRLVRSLQGCPVHEDDGEVLLERRGAAANFTDAAPQPGAWHYYAVFVLTDGVWYRAGIATTLMPKDQGYADRLFSGLPLYHQYLHGVGDNENPEVNETLKTFMSVLALGMDDAKTYYDQLLRLNDPLQNHEGQLVHLASQLGIDVPSVSEPGLFRRRVSNAGILGRQKGTLEQVRSVVALTTGWDVDLTVGPNLMLSEDAASFVHPTYAMWDPTINYPATERCTYNGIVYEAKTGGAYGTAQAPSGTQTANTWWTNVSGQRDDTLILPDGTVSGWGPVSYSAGVAAGTVSASVGVGIQSAVDPTVSSANALLLVNTAAQTADLGVTSTFGTDPLQAVKRGVPTLQVLPKWNSTVLYNPGDIVTYYTRVFRAKILSEGVSPSQTGADTNEWACIGDDLRPSYTTSLYVIGDPANRALLAYPVVQFFDDRGVLQATIDTSKTASTLNVYDSFGTKSTPGLSGRTTDVGGKTWAVTGTWQVSDHGTVYPLSTTARATLTGAADGKIAVTFASPPAAGQKQGVVFRYASATSYLKAARDGIYSSNGTTDTLVQAYSTAFSDGDRMVLALSGSTVNVLRNGTSVLSTTIATNTTATTHGIFVA